MRVRWTVRTILLLAGIGALWALSACSKEDSETAKQRVLDKKDVAEEVETRKVALTPIDLAKIPADVKELEKVLLMTQEETAERLKPYRFEAQVSYVTERPGKSVTLTEKEEMKQAVNGDFHLQVSNDKARTFELFWVGGKLFERMGESSFREATSGGKHLFWREKVSGTLDRFYKYFRGHLTFHLPTPETYEGRQALKLTFALDPNGKTPQDDLETNYNYPDQYAISAIAVDKMLNKNRKRVSRFEEAEGYLIVDSQSATILAYKLHGRYIVPVSEEKLKKMQGDGDGEQDVELVREVAFVMDAAYAIKDIGQPIEIKEPSHRKPALRDRPPESVSPLLPEGSTKNPELEARDKAEAERRKARQQAEDPQAEDPQAEDPPTENPQP
ncbi:MAG: hypothetical protein C4523_07315 [Myxococcales bacterium]|nr:MAG: hypothetical protein C4523_07315 [Myxococcales bacterium]